MFATLIHLENSDVLLLESVAVAVIDCPPVAGTLTLKLTLPPLSLVTIVEARKLCPSPLPEVSQDVFANNWMVKVEFGVLLSVP
jgi:hypothetical protein